MKFGASRSQLYDAHKSAIARWDEVCNWWGDSARKEHEEKVWIPYDEAVRDVLRAVDQLTVAFTEIRHQCEYNDE